MLGISPPFPVFSDNLSVSAFGNLIRQNLARTFLVNSITSKVIKLMEQVPTRTREKIRSSHCVQWSALVQGWLRDRIPLLYSATETLKDNSRAMLLISRRGGTSRDWSISHATYAQFEGESQLPATSSSFYREKITTLVLALADLWARGYLQAVKEWNGWLKPSTNTIRECSLSSMWKMQPALSGKSWAKLHFTPAFLSYVYLKVIFWQILELSVLASLFRNKNPTINVIHWSTLDIVIYQPLCW